MQKTKCCLLLLAIIVVISKQTYAQIAAETIALEPLTPIVFSTNCLSGEEKGQLNTTAFAIEVQGIYLNLDLEEIKVPKKSVYKDPLSCCVAHLRSLIEEDEVWYGQISANQNERTSTGQTKDGFAPDSSENLYSMFTYYKINPRLATRIIDAKIQTYFRVGGMHAFAVFFTLDKNGSTQVALGVVPIHEFNPGLYRFPYEWRHPDDKITQFLGRISEIETSANREYRISNSKNNHRIPITGLYGDTEGLFPLTLLFKGGIPRKLPQYKNFYHKISEVKDLVTTLPQDGHHKEKENWGKLKKLMNTESADMLDRQTPLSRGNLFDDVTDLAFIIDGKVVFWAFSQDNKTGELKKKFITFYGNPNSPKIVDLYMQNFLYLFLSDERVWPVFSDYIFSVIENE